MRGVGSRVFGVVLAVGLVAAACAPEETLVMTDAPPAASTTSRAEAPGSTADVTVTSSASTTISESAGENTTTQLQRFSYFVVAEEEARRLNVVQPAGDCAGTSESGCDIPVLLEVDLPERPHNLAAADGVAFATHPAAGSVSRVDLVTGSVVTSALGTEPHDVKYAPTTRLLYVADESGRRIFTLDPDTLDVIETVTLPGKPHDMALAGDAIWVTLVGRSDMARIIGREVEMFATDGSPHDVIVEGDDRVWFSNWDSQVLSVFELDTGSTVRAPAGVTQPHHFAITPDGVVWVSDNGGSSIVGFTDPQVAVEVGPVPHHLAFAGDTIIVAVSGTGQAVQVRDGRVVGRTQLTSGLHGVAVMETDRLQGP